MTRDDYARQWSSGHARTGQRTFVPENVQRVTEHEPCFMCGTRAGLECRHRRAA